jgi:hypothetical protein
MSVIPAVFYLPTGLAGCSVDPGISCGARKLTRTPRVKKKKTKKKERLYSLMQYYFIWIVPKKQDL